MLVVEPHLHRRRTGVTTHVEALVRALAGRADVKVLESAAAGRVLSRDLPRVGWREVRRRSRVEPVVWHAHRNVEVVAALVLRALGARLKLVVTRHAAHRPSRVTRWCLSRADRVVALTDEMAKTLSIPSTVIGHGVGLERFHPAPNREAEFASLGVGARFGIGVVGRVRPSKGQGDFVHAFAPISKEHPDWRAVVVGAARGRDRAWARTLARESDAIVLAGEQRDVERWLRAFTIVVQPSRAEGFSLALIEAMASGACVVAARLPHYATFLDDGRTGFFYEPGDVSALRERLSMLMREPDRAREVGAAAAAVARERFGIDREAAALLQLYREVAG